MFLLPSLLFGVVFALLLGGKLTRLVRLEFRLSGVVFFALAAQIVLFSPLAAEIPPEFITPLHVGTYGLLFLFAAANIHVLAMLPLTIGMALNAVAITLNGGHMPVSPDAWDAAGLENAENTNVAVGAERLAWLGDIFALPSSFPLANVFSVGDVVIAAGVVALIVTVSVTDGSERPLVPARILRPLAFSSYRRLVAGKLVSHLGDWLTVAALIGWVYKETGSTAQVAALLLTRLVPPVVGGGVAAAIVDRLPKARLLVWIEFARALTVIGAFGAVVYGIRPGAFAAVALSGVLAAVSATTVPALVPSLLDKDELPAANAGLGIAEDAAMAVGALVGAIALSTSGIIVALAINIGTFLVASVFYAGIRARITTAEVEDAVDGGGPGGLRYIFGKRILVVVIGAFGVATIATGLTNATLPSFLDGIGLGSGGYGFGLAALGCGLAAGQAAVGFSRVGPNAGRWIGVGLVLMASLFVTLAFTQHAPTALLVLGLIGLVDGTTDVLFNTIIQREVDPRYYGRVFGFGSAFFTTTMLGAVAAAPLVERIAPPQEAILAAGLALLVASSIAILGTRVRREGAEPGETEAEDSAFVPGRAAVSPLPDEEREPAQIVPLVAPSAVSGADPPPVYASDNASPLGRFRVVVRLNHDRIVPVARFESAAESRECARDLIRYVATLAPGEWPEIDGRFLRPDGILTVEIIEDSSIAGGNGARDEGPVAGGVAWPEAAQRAHG